MIEYVYEVRGTNDPIDGDHVRFTTKGEAVNYKESVKDKYPEAAVYMISYEFDDEDGNDGVFSIPKKLHEIQVSGPEVDANLADPDVPNSCEGDACDFRLPKEDDGLDDDLVGADDIEDVEENLTEEVDRYVKLVNDKFRTNQEFSLNDLKFKFKSCAVTMRRYSEKDINFIADFDNHCKVIKETDNGVLVSVPCYYRDQKDRTKISDTPKYIEVWLPKAQTKPITESVDDLDDDIESESFAEELFSALKNNRKKI